MKFFLKKYLEIHVTILEGNKKVILSNLLPFSKEHIRYKIKTIFMKTKP